MIAPKPPAWLLKAVDEIPATVVMAPKECGKLAAVIHCCGADHPNALAASARLVRKGFTVLPFVYDALSHNPEA
jgi:hypothetical protein